MNTITFSGLVQSGAGGLYPLQGKRVALYEATGGTSTIVGSGTTAANGWFSIDTPDFSGDFPLRKGNPGGDSIVIFVGLAKPPTRS